MARVLYISYTGLTDPIGQSQVIPYISGLCQKGHSYTVLSYEKPLAYNAHKDAISGLLQENNIRWIPLSYRGRLFFMGTVYHLIVGVFSMLRIIRKKNITLIHCRSYIPAMLGMIAKRLLGTPYIFDMRGFWVDERLEGGLKKGGIVYSFLKRVEESLIKHASAIVSLTQNAIEEMKKWPYVTEEIGRRLYHITTCAPTHKYANTFKKRFEKPFSTDQITFLYIGSVGPWHSFNRISEFIQTAYKTIPHSRFNLIVKEGKEILEKYILSSGFDQERFQLRTVVHKDIPAAIEDADIGFFFIKPAYAKIPSSPTKMGEMLAAGIPIITGHSIGDVDELVRENQIGYIIQDFSEHEYKAAIHFVQSLIQKDRNALANRCLEVANDYFSMEKGIVKYGEIYAHIEQKQEL